ncbi:MAG: hypothetical protein ACO1OB_09670 [Archangium sp.]
MAAKKQQPEAQQPEISSPSYPAIEGYIETQAAADIARTIQGLKDQLASLKGPRAEQAKKVGKAIERTEELLSYLMQVKEKLESDRKGKGGARK